MPTEVALFDLDGTLLPIDSDHAFTEYMADLGVVDAAARRAENDRYYADYLAGQLDISGYQAFAVSPLVGLSRQQLIELHRGFMTLKILPSIRPEALQLVREHQQRGALCAVVTATNSFVTAPIARAFGIEHLIASVAAMDRDGRITGELRGIAAYREGKVERVRLWLESMALSLAGLESTFYSDSHNDLPLLEQVGVPVATNPDVTLRAEAEQRGWRILDLFDRA